jgi:hypothetical protein
VWLFERAGPVGGLFGAAEGNPMPVSIQEAFGLWPEGDQSPADRPHLRHSSLAAWFKAEGLTRPLASTIKDEAELERRLHEYGQLKRFLFAGHLASLPEAERQEYRAGIHPSQSHRFRDRAQPIARQLQEELAGRGYAAKVQTRLVPHGPDHPVCRAAAVAGRRGVAVLAVVLPRV